ncbi:Uncharacterized protein EJ110_NYTH36528, partial [Nymphaea thermarum]
ASDRFNINSQLEHLQAKYDGTGHADLTNNHTSYIGRYPMLAYFSIAENESIGREQYNFMQLHALLGFKDFFFSLSFMVGLDELYSEAVQVGKSEGTSAQINHHHHYRHLADPTSTFSPRHSRLSLRLSLQQLYHPQILHFAGSHHIVDSSILFPDQQLEEYTTEADVESGDDRIQNLEEGLANVRSGFTIMTSKVDNMEKQWDQIQKYMDKMSTSHDQLVASNQQLMTSNQLLITPAQQINQRIEQIEKSTHSANQRQEKGKAIDVSPSSSHQKSK